MRYPKNFIPKNIKRDLQYDAGFISSNIITDIRLLNGLSQTQLSKKAKKHQPSLARAESGANGVSMTYLMDLARATKTVITFKVKKSKI